MATYYVSKEAGASDANAGTIGSPWSTLSKATSGAVVAGDTVLFRGGDTWTEGFSTGQDGTSSLPITFGAYGTGKPIFQSATGPVYFIGATYLIFNDIIVQSTTDYTNIYNGILTDSGCHHLEFHRVEVRNVRRGFNFNNDNHHMTVDACYIHDIGGSGIITGRVNVPSGGVTAGQQEYATITNNVINNTGIDAAALANDGACHGIYNDWRNAIISGNTVFDFNNSGISNRYRDATIENNFIDGNNRGFFGIAFHSYEVAGQQGTTKMTFNRIKRFTTTGIYVSQNAGVSVPDTQENLIMASNTFFTNSGLVGSAYIAVEKTTGFLRVKNNIGTGNGYRTLDVNYNPTGGYQESNNIWYTTGTYRIRYNGTDYASVAAYVTGSGQGAGDLSTNPIVDVIGLKIDSTSPAFNAGTASVTGLTYSNDCTGLLYSYCGTAPDIGAYEVLPIPWHGRGVVGALPVAPSAPAAANYTIPGGATVVTTIGQLETALAGGTAVDIKIMNGTYSRATEIVPGAAHRIYGESPAGVILNFGLRWNNMTNWKVKGITFNIPDAAHAATDGGFTAAVLNWLGSGTPNAEITDCYMTGAGLVGQGIQLGQPDGAILQRLVVSGFFDNGLRISDNSSTSTAVVNTISDLNISAIFRSTRGAADGTAEAGLWLGHKVTNPVARVKIRNIGWMGGTTNNACRDTTFTDFDIDVIYGYSPTGLNWIGHGFYFERWTRNVTLQNSWIGHEFGDVITGISSEWDNGFNAALSGSHTLPVGTLTVKDSTYDTTQFPASGTLYVGESGAVSVAYTGKTQFTFTGVTGGVGTFGDGTLVSTRATGYQATSYLTISNCYINCSSTRNTGRVGIYLDEGTRWPTVANTVFAGMDSAAIKDRSGTPHATNTIDTELALLGNDYSGRAGGAAIISYG